VAAALSDNQLRQTNIAAWAASDWLDRLGQRKTPMKIKKKTIRKMTPMIHPKTFHAWADE
jgi:hypothetical protein